MPESSIPDDLPITITEFDSEALLTVEWSMLTFGSAIADNLLSNKMAKNLESKGLIRGIFDERQGGDGWVLTTKGRWACRQARFGKS